MILARSSIEDVVAHTAGRFRDESGTAANDTLKNFTGHCSLATAGALADGSDSAEHAWGADVDFHPLHETL